MTSEDSMSTPHHTSKELAAPILKHLTRAGAAGIDQKHLMAMLECSDKTMKKYGQHLIAQGQAERRTIGKHVFWFADGMACDGEDLEIRRQELRRLALAKRENNIAKVTRTTERAHNVSAQRLVIEDALKTGQAYTSAQLAKLAGVTVDKVNNAMAKLLHQGTAKHGPRTDKNRVTYVWHTVDTGTAARRPEGAATSRIYVNSTMPNGSQDYWRQAMSWGR